jgi:2-methylcitrate dehydratase PrpD
MCERTSRLGHDRRRARQPIPDLETHAFKVWPACGYTRVTNAAAPELRTQHGLDPKDIESVAIIGGTGGTRLLSEPLSSNVGQRRALIWQYSIPFTTAMC